MATAHSARPHSPTTRIRSASEPAFGLLLRHHRLAAGLTQEKLAERAELSIRGISDLERGARRAPRMDTLVRLASALTLGPPERSIFEAAAKHIDFSPTYRPCNLSAPPTRLIGRDTEVAEVTAHLMRDDVRLVTLTGAGGVGKTRLAQEIALTLRQSYAGRVWQIELAHLRDAALVPAAVADVLGLEADIGIAAEETLMNHLRHTSALLVFDTFEHLPAAASLVTRLHSVCPELRFLVTSRTPLYLREEHQWLVRPLLMPDPERLPSPGDLSQYPAVSLFIDRARAVQSSFTLTSLNAATVAAICRRLDGLPLALELAANWVKMLLPKALLTGLERRLWQLTSGAQDVPERQRTLHANISWSYHLLSPVEKTLFRRLTVFVGGCTMAAVESVCQSSDEVGGSLFKHIATLIDKNLLFQLAPSGADENDESRYGMLETTREYGIECLTAVGELGWSRERHAAYFLTVDDMEPRSMDRAPTYTCAPMVNLDHENVRAALEYRRSVSQEKYPMPMQAVAL